MKGGTAEAKAAATPALAGGGGASWLSDWRAIIVLLVACLPWVMAVRAPFIDIDDPIYVTSNRNVLAGVSGAGIVQDFTTTRGDIWIPLTWLSLQLDVSLSGAHPPMPESEVLHRRLPAAYERLARVMHATNVLLHVANVLVLYWFLRRATGGVGRSLVVALLFAIHPLRVESVAWVTERKDVLSGLFGLLALVAYVRFARSGSWKAMAGVCVLFAMSLMAKPMLVTMPCLLLVLDYWPLNRWRRGGLRRIFLEKIPLLAISTAFSVLTFTITIAKKSLVPTSVNPLDRRIANVIESYGMYLRDTFYFGRLAIFYPTHPPAAGDVAVAGLALAGVSGLIVWLARRNAGAGGPALAGWLWYLGTMVPTSGLFQMGAQQRADRFTYFPSIGLFLVLAWIWPAAWLGSAARRRAAAAVVVAAVAALGIFTMERLRLWADPIALYLDAVARTEHNGYIESVLGGAYEDLDRLDQSEEWYRRAIGDVPGSDLFHHNLAAILAKEGRIEEAAQEFYRAVQLKPDSAIYRQHLKWAVDRLAATRAATMSGP